MINLSGYQILTQIYESANSEVYRARRETDRQSVILKVLKQDYPTPSELTRYKQEYELTRNLNLEGIIKAYSLEKYQNTLVIILEDFGGESLIIFTKNARLSLTEFISIAIKIATSLGKIHGANIIHKDINPGNIVFNPETQQLKIIDFGISTKLNRENPTLKNPNVLEGTLAYISPEQTGRMNRSLDYRTDFYSLGVTFYELLTGKLPFETQDDLELVHCHLAKQPLSPSEIHREIPPILSEIIIKLMAKNAEDRYQSGWGIKADLETCLSQLKTNGKIDNFVLASQDISDKFQIPQKLYGRETEIQTLITAFERVTERSELMLVAGYSGIGKSALVQEIYKPIAEKRGNFIAGKFDQFQRNIPYSAMVVALRGLVQQLLTEKEAQLNAWKQTLLGALGANGQVIIDVIPELELVIGKQPPVPELEPTPAQNRFNLVFQNFIRACCTKEHPLVIFLDDLQWADGATLKLIELMMTDVNLSYLFLICAYRDNEVSLGHPFRMMLDELGKTRAVINEISLSNLALEDVSLLVADSLKSRVEDVQSLGNLVFKKTQGNPFFVNQFLTNLYAEHLLNFNYQEQKWEWDLEEIEGQNITDNVVELMVGKLQKLPTATREILELAACVGASFDLDTLSIIEEKSSQEVFSDLIPGLESGLVLPLSKLDEELLIKDYQFLHDRVQQAAYSLIADEDKERTHYRIGQLLLEKFSPEEKEERIFELVNQLNYGVSLIVEDNEKEELARLNLVACRKARAATAYQAAGEYADVALSLLGEDGWEQHYEMTLTLHELAAEVAYLSGEFERMEGFVDVVVEKAHSLLEKVNVYRTRIQANVSRNKPTEAIAIALKVLQKLGVAIPETPTEKDIQSAIAEIQQLIGDREVEDLIHLPMMVDREKIAILGIASSILAVAYALHPILFPVLNCLIVKLSIKHGNTQASCLAYVGYSAVACSLWHDVGTGIRFTKLALQLLSKLDAKTAKPQVLNFAGGLILHRTSHLKETLLLLQEGYAVGLEAGNLLFAAYDACMFCFNSFWCGQHLDKVEQESRVYYHTLMQLNQLIPVNLCRMLWQSILNLLEVVENPTVLSGEACQETDLLALMHSANLRTGLRWFYSYKLMLCYLFEEIGSAKNCAVEIERYLMSAKGMIFEPIFYFYNSLTVLAELTQNSEEFPEVLQKVEQNQTELQQNWARHAPMNYSHKWQLVEAEKYRVLGQKAEAIELYDLAIAGTKENEYIQEEALANELAAKFYLQWDKEKIARTYMQEARYCYELWGAAAKVKHLEENYPQLLNSTSPSNRPQGTITTRVSTDSNSGLDIATVMKANQAISGEIVLDKLLVALMKIVIENAGAQTGYLILANQDKLVIQVSGVIDSEGVNIGDSVPLENCDALSETVVNYVARSKEAVVLNDAAREGNFTNDAYIQKHRPKSILCVPLINQGRLVSIVYLENNLTTGAFTAERVEILNLLSSQAAISIENAKLYNNMAALNNAYERFVPNQFLQLLENESIIDVKLGDRVQLEMSILFSDIRDFTTLSEGMTPEDNFKFINAYLSRMESAILDNNGFIDKYIGDAIMALFSGDADNAVKGGIGMLEQLKIYNQKRINSGYVPIKIGIGINTGSIILGTVGGRNRMDSTVISDAVNLASRVESLTKNYEVALLITQQTYQRLVNPNDYAIRMIDTVKVKGKSEFVTVYEVFDADSPEVKEGKLETLGIFNEALSLYEEKKLTEAGRLFGECLSCNSGDKVAEIYLERCQG